MRVLSHIIALTFLRANFSESAQYDYEFLGCFKEEHTLALPHQIEGYFRTNTECNAACSASDFLFSTRRNLDECYCGTSLFEKDEKFEKLDETGCECEYEFIEIGVNCVYKRKLSEQKLATSEKTREMKQSKAAKVEKAVKVDKVGKKSKLKKQKGDKNTFDVVIVGAGWAGLGAANSLISSGINNIKVIEACDVIGGRSKALTFSDGLTVNAGANWIHQVNPLSSTGTNLVYEAFLETQLETVIDQQNSTVYMSYGNGTKLDNSYLQKFEAIFNDLFSFLYYYADHSSSVRDIANAFIADYGDKMNDNDLRYFELVLKLVGLEFASSVEDISATDFISYFVDYSLGLEIFIPSYASLLEYYARKIPKDLFLMKSIVTNIHYGRNIIKLDYVTEKNIIKQISAKKVIITVPLGVLKAKKIAFEPQLPSWKSDSIESIKFGKMDQVISVWNEGTKLPWETGTDLQALRRIDRISADINNQGKWSVWFTYPLPSNSGVRQISLAYNYGRDLVEINEDAKDDKDLEKRNLDGLKKIFGEANVPDPDDVIVKSWSKDPFTLGGYSSSQPDANISKPVDDKLYFAGEATSINHPATTHGALQSGLDAAKLLIENIQAK